VLRTIRASSPSTTSSTSPRISSVSTGSTSIPHLLHHPAAALRDTPGEHHLGFDTFDLVNQRLVSHHYWIKDGAARTFHSLHRFVWPSELDLMAKLAGLDLRERWADWNETPFTAASTSHVSVWQKPHG
jgi:hypothetical protein